MRLRGRGRVRQGVCPFHDEAEGSFTVYGDSERFYCFGCGAGGDVLDFVRRVENLSLPEAIARLDGSPRACAQGRQPSSRTAASQVRRAGPPRPRLADGGGAFLRRSTPAQPRRLGVPGLAGRRPVRGSPPRPRLCAGQRAASWPWSPDGFSAEAASRTAGLFMERGAERFSGMMVVPDASGGLVSLARRAGRRPRPDAPVPGVCPAPSRCLGLGVLGLRRPWVVVAEGVFDWLALAGWGLPTGAALGTQGMERIAAALRGCPSRLPRLRRRRCGPGGDGAASVPARTQGRRRRPS